MRALLQRVRNAGVTVEGRSIARIGYGLLILLGIGREDTIESAISLADKAAHLRIFEDEEEKMNLSILDVHGEAIVVSQFTLYANTRKGNRPSFTDAASPTSASSLVDEFTRQLNRAGVAVQTGMFGAHMEVDLINDGPVTILLEA